LPGPSSSSPRLDFNSLNLTQPMPGEYSYSSGSYTTLLCFNAPVLSLIY